VLFIPIGEAPHKEIEGDPGAEVRVELCERAVEGDPRFSVSRAEVDRPGPSYTVETLRLLRERSPEHQLTLILGADQASRLPSWREPHAVLSLARVAVAERAGLEHEAVLRRLHGLAGADRIAFFEMPRVDISSSLLRRRAASGRPMRYLVPHKVAEIVEARGLYGASTVVRAE
jgi:nicotinate-nucleotide adenylyltransferase